MDISNLVAHAFRDMARSSDIANQNGGGARIDLGAGDVSVGDAYQVQPFSDTLVEIQMFGTEIQDMLEGSFDRDFSPDGSIGAYPYAARLSWHITASMEK